MYANTVKFSNEFPKQLRDPDEEEDDISDDDWIPTEQDDTSDKDTNLDLIHDTTTDADTIQEMNHLKIQEQKITIQQTRK